MAKTGILWKALDTRWRRLQKDWDRARRKFSNSAIHDLRVASRRMIAALDTLRSLVDDPAIDECRRQIKKLLGALSPLRDVQVQQGIVAKMASRFDHLKGFQKSLKQREGRIAKKAQKLLKKRPKTGRDMKKAMQLAKGQSDAAAITGVLDKRFDEVIALAGAIDTNDTATIHRMRLAFKKFRYTAEVVRRLVKDEMTAERLKQLHAFQTMMGNIQDMEVLSARLLKWSGKDEQRMKEMQPVIADIDRQKQENIRIFLGSMAQVYSFWHVNK